MEQLLDEAGPLEGDNKLEPLTIELGALPEDMLCCTGRAVTVKNDK